jgi:hypothetical protein
MAIISDSMGPADIAAVTGGNGNNGWNGDGSIWIWVLFLFALMGGWGNNGNNGGGYVGYPIMGNTVQNGFDQAAVMAGLNGITSNLATGFANAEVSRCNGQTNILQALNNNQANLTNQLNTIAMNQQNCGCENRAATAETKFVVANEGAATRSNTDAKVQMVMDKLCQLELDGVRQNYENRIATMEQNYQNQMIGMQNQIDALRSQVFNDRFDASQNNQTATIQAGQRALANEVEQYVLPTPRPAYIVANPNCCGQNYYGYGCGGM